MSSRRDRPYQQMKSLDILFGESQESESPGTQIISIEAICLPPQQPRRYFDEQSMLKLVESVRQHGILQPLLVRPSENNKYELVAGERRYRAAKELALAEVPVIVRILTDEEAIQLSLIENLCREDLNAYEETIGILELLALRLKTTQEKAISLLNRMEKANRKQGNEFIQLDGEQADNIIRSEDVETVNNVFASIGRLSPESFRANRLPILNLPSDVLSVLKVGQMEYTKARAIAVVKDEEQRAQVLEEAIQNSLSLSQIKEMIRQLPSSEVVEIPPDKVASQRYDNLGKRLKETKAWSNPKKRKKLEKLLGDIERLLEDDLT